MDMDTITGADRRALPPDAEGGVTLMLVTLMLIVTKSRPVVEAGVVLARGQPGEVRAELWVSTRARASAHATHAWDIGHRAVSLRGGVGVFGGVI